MEKFTKIVCTLGPSSDSSEIIEKLYKAGMNVARLNFSHGNYEYFTRLIENIRGVSDEIAILLDTKGPEIRTGEVRDGLIVLEDNQTLVLTKKKIVGDEKRIYLDYYKLDKLEIGNTVLIDDGLIECRVVKNVKDGVEVKVLNGGNLGSKKTVTIRGHDIEIPFLSEKDIEDINYGIEQGVDFIAASFVRKSEEVLMLRKILAQKNSDIAIISKIEHPKSVENFEAILKQSDGIMIARGDLGVEVPLVKVPQIQFDMVRRCREQGKPVIVATHMLESMRVNPRPTRAEVSDVAQAIIQGTDAIMLSSETASGKYPVKSVEMMARIAKEYDFKIQTKISEDLQHGDRQYCSISLFITNTAYEASKSLNTKAILVPTETGFTARNVSRFRPKCPIYTLTWNMGILRQLQLSRGVFPMFSEKTYYDRDVLINEFVMNIYEKKLVESEDKIVVTAGFKLAKKGYTNIIEIYKIKDIVERNFDS